MKTFTQDTNGVSTGNLLLVLLALALALLAVLAGRRESTALGVVFVILTFAN